MKKRPILLLISIVYLLIILFPIYETGNNVIPRSYYNTDYDKYFDYILSDEINISRFLLLSQDLGDTYSIKFFPMNGRVNTTYTFKSNGNVVYHTHIVLNPGFLHGLYDYNDNEFMYNTQRNIVNYTYFWLSFVILFTPYFIYLIVKRRREEKEHQIQGLISKGEVTIGMSKEQIIESLGDPNKFTESTSGNNKSTVKYEYYYEDMTVVVTLIDGIVKDIIRESGFQNSKK